MHLVNINSIRFAPEDKFSIGTAATVNGIECCALSFPSSSVRLSVGEQIKYNQILRKYTSKRVYGRSAKHRNEKLYAPSNCANRCFVLCWQIFVANFQCELEHRHVRREISKQWHCWPGVCDGTGDEDTIPKTTTQPMTFLAKYCLAARALWCVRWAETRTSYGHHGLKTVQHLHRKIEIDKTYSGFGFLSCVP